MPMKLLEKWIGKKVDVALKDDTSSQIWKLVGFDEFGVMLEDVDHEPPYERFFAWHYVEFIGPENSELKESSE